MTRPALLFTSALLAICCLLDWRPLHARDAGDGETLIVGSKKFTESVILGELAAMLAFDADTRVKHIRDLGGSRVLWSALQAGEIDVYPEYTGTIRLELLSSAGATTDEELRARLAEIGIVMTDSLGFDNTYALGMKRAKAAELGLRTISDLTRQPKLAFGFSNEFMNREDGWPGLRRRYRLPQQNVTGLDHDLAYRGLEADTIAVTDVYSTDAEIQQYDLTTLVDDLKFFPAYRAVLLIRAEAVERFPEAVAAMRRLEGAIDERTMQQLNAAAKVERQSTREVASSFLRERLGVSARFKETGRSEQLVRYTIEHLTLVGLSLAAAVLIAVPTGVVAASWPALGQVILGFVGIVQTIPSLALLVFMIPLLGIGPWPAMVALFLYSLLPIVRSTYQGLMDIPPPLRESAAALGLPPLARLRLIELPMATRAILSGIKTAAVINIGTATLGALIGAGGYGQPILTGIRLDDFGLILLGAVPAAVLALLVQVLFELVDRVVVPKGMRL